MTAQWLNDNLLLSRRHHQRSQIATIPAPTRQKTGGHLGMSDRGCSGGHVTDRSVRPAGGRTGHYRGIPGHDRRNVRNRFRYPY